jgi:type II secretory pathway pseudopilin PulG
MLEILSALSLVAILVSLIIIAWNPASRGNEARNAVRWSHVNMLVNALHEYALDHGTYPIAFSEDSREICRGGITPEICAESGLLYLGKLSPDYLPILPIDPSIELRHGTGYAVSSPGEDRIIVSALLSEEGDLISVSR